MSSRHASKITWLAVVSPVGQKIDLKICPCVCSVVSRVKALAQLSLRCKVQNIALEPGKQRPTDFLVAVSSSVPKMGLEIIGQFWYH